MPNYLVTGGAGFIGSSIVETLVQRGENVRVLDNCSTGKLSNLQSVSNDIEFIQGDIRDLPLVREAVKGIDYVIHQAAIVSVDWSVKDPMRTNQVNTHGSLNMLIAARDANVKRLVFASSSSIYGDSQIMPKREDMCPDPISPYAISKHTGEQYCKVFYKLYSLETVVLRYFNVFGPKQSPDSQYAAAIPIFINAFLEDRSPIVFGDGKQSRDFVFVEDVAQANLLACHTDIAAGQVFNIASGKSITINSLVKTIKELVGSNIEAVHEQERQGDIRHSQADISRTQTVLGYKPGISIKEGLERTIEWFRNIGGT